MPAQARQALGIEYLMGPRGEPAASVDHGIEKQCKDLGAALNVLVNLEFMLVDGLLRVVSGLVSLTGCTNLLDHINP